ncbi:hypothetical protein ACFLS1_12770 [Verrucomicrobiota bacterium]
MKKAGLILLFFGFLIVPNVFAEDVSETNKPIEFDPTATIKSPASMKGSRANKNTAFELSIWPNMQLCSTNTGVRGLRISLMGWNRDLSGLDIGLINFVTDDVAGLQVGGFINSVGRDMKGVQAAYGLVNMTGKDVIGLQVAFAANGAEGNVRGVQVASLMNISKGDVTGVQCSGFSGFMGATFFAFIGYNRANDLKGLQVTMAYNEARNANGVQTSIFYNAAKKEIKGLQATFGVNYAQSVKGVQIGFVNYCRELCGVQIGAINISSEHKFPCVPILNVRF